MTDHPAGHDLPPPDMTGHVQPDQTTTPFTMTVENAVYRYAQLGHPRNARSIRRFCKQGSIDCRKVRTSNFAELYLIDPASIDRHVKEISETFPIAPPDLATHDLPRQDIAGHDQPTVDDVRYITLLEKVNADQAEQLKTKDEQLKINDTQIVAMLERDRETNFLIRGLQTLLGLPDHHEPSVAHDIPKERAADEQPLSPAP